MITKKQLATTAPRLAMVVSFLAVLLLGQWIGSAVKTGNAAGPGALSTVAPPAGEDAGGADKNRSPESPRRRVVVLDVAEQDDPEVAELPADTRLADGDDLSAEKYRGRDGKDRVCVALPSGAHVQERLVRSYCTDAARASDLRIQVER